MTKNNGNFSDVYLPVRTPTFARLQLYEFRLNRMAVRALYQTDNMWNKCTEYIFIVFKGKFRFIKAYVCVCVYSDSRIRNVCAFACRMPDR